MKFKNKKTGSIVETTVDTITEMYKKKPEYEEVKETKKTTSKEKTE